MTDDQVLSDAKAAFALCEEAEAENRIAALADGALEEGLLTAWLKRNIKRS